MICVCALRIWRLRASSVIVFRKPIAASTENAMPNAPASRSAPLLRSSIAVPTDCDVPSIFDREPFAFSASATNCSNEASNRAVIAIELPYLLSSTAESDSRSISISTS